MLKVGIPVLKGPNRSQYNKLRKRKRRVTLRLLSDLRASGLTERMINVAMIKSGIQNDYKQLKTYV